MSSPCYIVLKEIFYEKNNLDMISYVLSMAQCCF